jgi:putative phage-type endonuclease
MLDNYIKLGSEAEWLAARLKYITSTDIAGLFGLSRYKSGWQTWHEKKDGYLEKIENNRMKWGKRLQDAIAFGVAEDMGWTIPRKEGFNNCLFVRPSGELASSIDHPAIDKDGRQILIECKVVSQRYFDIAFDEETGEVPPDYEFQLQAEMLCTGIDRSVLACLVDGDQPKMFYRDIDHEAGAAIEKRVSAFWTSLRENKEPKPDYAATPDQEAIDALAKVMKCDSVLDMTGNNLMPELCAKLMNAQGELKLSETLVDSLKAQIKHAILGEMDGVISASEIEARFKQQSMKVLIAGGYSISMPFVKESIVPSYTRGSYRSMRVFKKEEK